MQFICMFCLAIDKIIYCLSCKMQEQYLDALAVAVQAVVVGQCFID